MLSNIYIIFDSIIDFFLNLIHKYFYERYETHTNVSPFNKNQEDNLIFIIEIEHKNEENINCDNILKYLNHHILLQKSIFYVQYFKKPIIVKFKYMGNVYRICLKKMECKNDQHSTINKNPKILSAFIKKDNNEIDVTDILKEFHGNNKNYFAHIPDSINVITELSYLLKHEGELEIYDMIGNINKYDIKNNSHKELSIN